METESQSTSKSSSESRRLVLTASKLPQLVRCSRSVLEQPDYVVDRKSQPKNPAAARGIKIHSVIEAYIKNDLSLEEAYNKAKQLDIVSDFKKIDWQSVNNVVDYYDAENVCYTEQSMAGSVNGQFRFIESYEKLNDTDSIAGTADLIMYHGDHFINVIDWKTGLDVIDAQNNEQLMILAYMFCKAKNIKPVTIVLTICCPVTGVNDDRYDSVWSTSYSAIESWVRHNVNEFTFKQEAGPHCRYCKLKQNCSSFRKMAEDATKELDALADV